MAAGRWTPRSSPSRRRRRSGSPRRATRRPRNREPRRRSSRPTKPRKPRPIDTLRTPLLRRARGPWSHGPQGGTCMRRRSIPLGVVLVVLAMGCHREVEMTPLVERTIYPTDRFYDVQAVSKDRAVVVGYNGKMLETRDRGRNWNVSKCGAAAALYGVRFVDEDHGWVVGQDGLIMNTADGGKTWTNQESNATFEESDGTTKRAYLFNIDAVDQKHAWAVGDRSILVSTNDGGQTWRSRKVQMEGDLSGGQSLAAADPILYDVKFVDPQNGWIVGEFGKILRTHDGGETWKEQTKSLLEGTDFFHPPDSPPPRALRARRDGHAACGGGRAGGAHRRDQRRRGEVGLQEDRGRRGEAAGSPLRRRAPPRRVRMVRRGRRTGREGRGRFRRLDARKHRPGR